MIRVEIKPHEFNSLFSHTDSSDKAYIKVRLREAGVLLKNVEHIEPESGVLTYRREFNDTLTFTWSPKP